MATYTEHYGLHQWLPEDNFLRTDFNTDFQKIDIALGMALKIVTGTYTGTSSLNGGVTQQIELGFRPRLVMIVPDRQNFGASDQSALAIDGTEHNGVTINDTGFQVKGKTNLEYHNEVQQADCNPYRYLVLYA